MKWRILDEYLEINFKFRVHNTNWHCVSRRHCPKRLDINVMHNVRILLSIFNKLFSMVFIRWHFVCQDIFVWLFTTADCSLHWLEKSSWLVYKVIKRTKYCQQTWVTFANVVVFSRWNNIGKTINNYAGLSQSFRRSMNVFLSKTFFYGMSLYGIFSS